MRSVTDIISIVLNVATHIDILCLHYYDFIFKIVLIKDNKIVFIVTYSINIALILNTSPIFNLISST